MSKLSKELGGTIRRVRKDAGLTLSQLAHDSKCSKSLISQIETGAVSPSLASLSKVCNCLGIPIGSLFETGYDDNDDHLHIMHPQERKTLTTKDGVSTQLLSKGLRLPCEFTMNSWPPGTSTSREIIRHQGEECGLLLEGELVVEVNGEIRRMQPGDTITFRSNCPHRISNQGSKEAVAIWVNTEPHSFAIL